MEGTNPLRPISSQPFQTRVAKVQQLVPQGESKNRNMLNAVVSFEIESTKLL